MGPERDLDGEARQGELEECQKVKKKKKKEGEKEGEHDERKRGRRKG